MRLLQGLLLLIISLYSLYIGSAHTRPTWIVLTQAAILLVIGLYLIVTVKWDTNRFSTSTFVAAFCFFCANFDTDNIEDPLNSHFYPLILAGLWFLIRGELFFWMLPPGDDNLP